MLVHLMNHRLFYIFSIKCGVHIKKCETVDFDQSQTEDDDCFLSTIDKLYE